VDLAGTKPGLGDKLTPGATSRTHSGNQFSANLVYPTDEQRRWRAEGAVVAHLLTGRGSAQQTDEEILVQACISNDRPRPVPGRPGVPCVQATDDKPSSAAATTGSERTGDEGER